jgi:long-subunit acyl-CoA synthetase (AMP-forming)
MSYVAEAVARAGATPTAVAVRFHEYGIWRPVTWAALIDEAAKLGSGLAAVGVKSGDAVGLLMSNHPSWIAADLAIQGLGAVVVPIDPDVEGAQAVSLLESAGAVCVLCGDQEQFDKVDELQTTGRASSVKMLVVHDTRGVRHLDNLARDDRDRVMTFAQLGDRATGSEWRQAVSALSESGPAVRFGGSVWSHLAVAQESQRVASALGLSKKDRLLALASFANPVERALSLGAMVSQGVEVALGEGGPISQQELAAVQPSVFHAAPGFLDRTGTMIGSRVGAAKGLRKWALSSGWKPRPPRTGVAKPAPVTPFRVIMLAALLLSVIFIFVSISMNDIVRLLIVVGILLLGLVVSVVTGAAVVTPLRRQLGMTRVRAVIGTAGDSGSHLLGALGVPLLSPDALLSSQVSAS